MLTLKALRPSLKVPFSGRADTAAVVNSNVGFVGVTVPGSAGADAMESWTTLQSPGTQRGVSILSFTLSMRDLPGQAQLRKRSLIVSPWKACTSSTACFQP